MAKKNVGYLDDVLKVMEASRKVMIIREGFTGMHASFNTLFIQCFYTSITQIGK